MSHTQTFVLATPQARQNALAAVQRAPEGHAVIVKKPVRSELQNDALHALLADLVKAKPVWAGERMGIDDWKALMVHALDVHEGRSAGRAVPGVEGGVVLLRRQTRYMTKPELSELIEYVTSTMVKWGIPIRDRHHEVA